MSNERDVTRIVRSWLEEGVTALPDRVLDNVLDRLPATRQRRPLWPVRKVGEMNTVFRIALAAAAVLVVALLGINLNQRPGGTGTGPSPTPSSTPPAIPASSGASGTLTELNLAKAVKPGTYRVAAPFAVPFTITFASEWTFRSLDPQDAAFSEADPTDATMSAAWLKVNIVDNVFADPCHTESGPTALSAKTVDATVAGIGSIRGFAHGAITDVAVGGYSGKHLVLTNSIDTGTAGCTNGGLLPMWTWSGSGPMGAGTNGGADDEIWVIDVRGRTIVIDGETGGLYSLMSYSKELETIVNSMTFQP